MNLSGFRGTPLTRLLVFALLLASLLTSLTNTKHYFHLQLRPHLLHYHQFTRIFLWQTIYANSGELLFACAVLYNLRVMERMFGTRKFASFMVVSWVGTCLAGVAVLGVGKDEWWEESAGRWEWNYLPPGPTAVVFALLAQYHAAVPSIYNIQFLPSGSSSSSYSSQPQATQSQSASEGLDITLTDKLPTYILATQLAFSQPPGSLLAAAVGWIFGYAYRAEIVPGARWRVPGWLFDRSGGEYENLRRRLAAGEFAGPEERGEGARRPLMGQILDQFRGAF
ncbi:hypothetical protein L211DRAFT_809359 [Terfezia boudieri ATCC MYA-4762]|uniref:Peptidase S54 rhomboid domain-containing protein n=1 Tax=Terfezia boudieri ATCC MYA-4762 TaxID=1051890 RepID=A0A3N4LKC8_9PEZI|nr:hypothetical protein L211DRAFT_809359 [Terfezia boudieri ATCC MYA-4762]